MTLYFSLNILVCLLLTFLHPSHSQRSHFKDFQSNDKTAKPFVTSGSYSRVSRTYSENEFQNFPNIGPRIVPRENPARRYDVGTRNDIDEDPYNPIDRIYFPTIHVQRYKAKLEKEMKKKEKEEKEKKEKEEKMKEEGKMKQENEMMNMKVVKKPNIEENTSSYMSYSVPGHGQSGTSIVPNAHTVIPQEQSSYSSLPYQSVHPGSTLSNAVPNYNSGQFSSYQYLETPLNTPSQETATTDSDIVSVDPKVIGMGVRAALLLAFIIIIIWIWITDIFDQATYLGKTGDTIIYARSNANNILNDFFNSWGTDILQSIDLAEETYRKMEKQSCNLSLLCYLRNFLSYINSHSTLKKGHFSRYRHPHNKKAVTNSIRKWFLKK